MARMAVASAGSRHDEAPTDLAQDMDALPRESQASQSLLPWKTSSPMFVMRGFRLPDSSGWETSTHGQLIQNTTPIGYGPSGGRGHKSSCKRASTQASFEDRRSA